MPKTEQFNDCLGGGGGVQGVKNNSEGNVCQKPTGGSSRCQMTVSPSWKLL